MKCPNCRAELMSDDNDGDRIYKCGSVYSGGVCDSRSNLCFAAVLGQRDFAERQLAALTARNAALESAAERLLTVISALPTIEDQEASAELGLAVVRMKAVLAEKGVQQLRNAALEEVARAAEAFVGTADNPHLSSSGIVGLRSALQALAEKGGKVE